MNKKTKKKVEDQVYEDYWDLNMAWTDFNGEKFLTALKISIDFIKNLHEEYSDKDYPNLQQKISVALDLDLISTRKGINELVKLGFINSFLKGYHPLSEEYLQAQDDESRRLLLSKIVYSNASFRRKVTKESDTREINFIVKTLEQQKVLEEKYLGSLISVNISDYPLGYVTHDELEKIFRTENQTEFEKRKYNQIDYVSGLLRKLEGIGYKKGRSSREGLFFLKKDSDSIQFEDNLLENERKGRDPYLQRIYKHQLEQESITIYGKIKCMVEGLSYPILIASHIKPFRMSDSTEAFDPNNGLLLSRTLDSLFDKNYISFNDDGTIIFYDKLADDVKDFWKSFRLKQEFLTPERLKYMAQHRELCQKENSPEKYLES